MRQHMIKIFRNKRLEAGLLICLAVFLVVPVCIAGEKKAASYPELPLGEMRIVAYTKTFAKRFGLPVSPKGYELQEGGGVEAMEFIVEKGPAYLPVYHCNLKVYLEDKLPIIYPGDNRVGAYDILISVNHFFGSNKERWARWPEGDKKHFVQLSQAYTMTTFLTSADYSFRKKGFSTSCKIEEYYRNIIPGVSYLKIDMGSFPLPSESQLTGPMQLWLKRTGGTDYSKQLMPNPKPEDFFRFDLPALFYQQMRPSVDEVRKFNDNYFKEHR